MCNSNGCGCCLLNSFANAIGNLFSTAPYCGCNGTGNGCGCNNGGQPTAIFTNGFLSGVNAANAVNNSGNSGTGCGCNGNNGNGTGCGCGGNNGNGCGCGGYDPYYAQQYGLYPFNTGNGNCPCNG